MTRTRHSLLALCVLAATALFTGACARDTASTSGSSGATTATTSGTASPDPLGTPGSSGISRPGVSSSSGALGGSPVRGGGISVGR